MPSNDQEAEQYAPFYNKKPGLTTKGKSGENTLSLIYPARYNIYLIQHKAKLFFLNYPL
jgi:hypothetical protein